MTVAQLNYLRTIEERRHNQAQEEIAREQQDVQRYVADTQATSSRYATDKQFESNVYGVDTSAATQRYVADQNAETQRFVAQTNAETSRYATDRQADTQAARLAFDQDTQAFRNQLSTYQLKLDEISRGAETDLKRAQIKKMTADTTVALRDMQLKAQRLGLDQEVAEYENKLRTARTIESYLSSGERFSNILNKVWDWFRKI